MKILIAAMFAALMSFAFSSFSMAGDTFFPMKSGTTYQTFGNTTYGSSGTSYQTFGNTTYGSDGSSSQTFGNTTYGSGGTACQTYGNTTYCN